VAAKIEASKMTLPTINAKLYKQALIDNDSSLTANDKTDLSSLAKQISWLELTVKLGQVPRTYASLMKITSNILDVCSMTESDFMRLTGKTGWKKKDGTYQDAKDYHGNAIANECATFGNDANGVFKYTSEDAAKIGIPFDIAQA